MKSGFDRKTAAEAAVLALLLLSPLIFEDSVPTATPQPVVTTLLEGTGPVPSFNLKYIGPLESRIYDISLSSDYAVSIAVFASFQDLENFAQMKQASYYTNCSAESVTSARIGCATSSGAYIGIYNSGENTASVTVSVKDVGASYATGFFAHKGTGTITSPQAFTATALG